MLIDPIVRIGSMSLREIREDLISNNRDFRLAADELVSKVGETHRADVLTLCALAFQRGAIAAFHADTEAGYAVPENALFPAPPRPCAPVTR